MLPARNYTPHTWVAGVLPRTVYEKDGDIYSPHVQDGYLRIVRRRGQGYSASWIVAQFRFAQALQHMWGHAAEGQRYEWFMIGDDDTIVNLNHLAKRLRQLDSSLPWYLSRKGWGGAGHIYSIGAMKKLMSALPKCVEKYFIRSFRASDDMLLRCAHIAHLHCHAEGTMSHCPASHLGVANMLSESQTTFHGKKDFYPPVLLTSWRVGLYYYATYCKDRRAAELAVFYSACAFGSCKQVGCTKEKNVAMLEKWTQLSNNSAAFDYSFR